jgi:hypothetical protein
MYDMRQPLGSSWRVTREFRMITKNPMPIRDVTKVRIVMLHGFRDRGRRIAGDLGPTNFPIASTSERSFDALTFLSRMSMGSVDGE